MIYKQFSSWHNIPLMGEGLLIVGASQPHSDTPRGRRDWRFKTITLNNYNLKCLARLM